MAVAETRAGNWPRDALPRGTTTYGYEIVGFLGRGGFGITYRAVDRINQVFALKECLPRQFAVREATTVMPADDDYAGEMFSRCLESFTKEALALTRFSESGAAGDGVVKVITSFETDGTAYIVMEFIEGDSLERLIGAYPSGLPEQSLVPIFRGLTDTLAGVHGYDLLHRDIKPANLILREDGRPVLLDFGAARAVRADGPMPSQIFTETYAPIEQIEGRQQGPFSDLYSMGVTCYQAVAGAAFRGAPPSSDRFRAILRREPDPLRRRRRTMRRRRARSGICISMASACRRITPLPRIGTALRRPRVSRPPNCSSAISRNMVLARRRIISPPCTGTSWRPTRGCRRRNTRWAASTTKGWACRAIRLRRACG